MGDPYQRFVERGDDAYETLARASGQKPSDTRWTELAIYRRRSSAPPDYPGPFIAEVIGETLIEGEERRVKRGEFCSVIAATEWGAFNQKSDLYKELVRKASRWLEDRIREAGMVAVRTVGRAADLPPPAPAARFEGTTFHDALCWLYAPLTGDIAELVYAFVADWAATPETVNQFSGGIYPPIGPDDVLDVMEHEEEYGLPAWADVFTRAMRHFDRESFIAARNG